MGGFECSTHRNYKNKRVDVIAATEHERFAESDYDKLLSIGMRTARDGVRWHLIEKEPFRYDFSSLENQAKAARLTGIEIIWDFFHYGFPDDLDIFSDAFIERFTEFSVAVAQYLRSETNGTLWICPTNEISFFAWIAGEVGLFYPFVHKRGDDFKRQLVQATISAMDAIWQILPDTRFVQTDPSIRVLPSPSRKNPQTIIDAKNFHDSQFHALDMQTGKRESELGGADKYLDILGVNYYSQNQWRHPTGRRIYRHHKVYQPFHELLENFYARYKQPVFIAETGIENEKRPEWFRYMFEQSKIAEANGVPVQGICLYPILNHPGWDDDRHCRNGLWDYADDDGERQIYQPLASEIRKFVV